MHQQEVMRVALQSHFVDYPCRHRYCGNTGCADQGINRGTAEFIHDFRHDYAGRRADAEGNRSQA